MTKFCENILNLSEILQNVLGGYLLTYTVYATAILSIIFVY